MHTHREGRSGTVAALILAILATTIVMTSCADPSPEAGMRNYLKKVRREQPNVLLITVDTLRQDHLGCYGYGPAKTPNLDAFFKEGIGFAAANTCAPITLPSHTSILTGMYPTYHGVRDNGAYSLRKTGLTMTEAMKADGYSTGAVVSAFVLDKRFGLDKGFDSYDDDFSDSVLNETKWSISPETYGDTYDYYQRRADEVTESALEWLNGNRDNRFFLWAHYFDPHAPYYRYSENGSRPVLQAPSPSPTGQYSADYAKKVIEIYDLEITYTDFWIGKLLDTLAEWDLDESTLVIIVSDHGESLGEHDYYFQHGGALYDTILRVPLMLRLPYNGPRGVVVEDIVSTIDIAPTVYQLLGIQPRVRPHGSSLVPLAFGFHDGRPPHVYGETLLPIRFGKNELRTLKTPRYKLIHSPASGKRLLFDLERDPEEIANILEDDAGDDKAPLGQYGPLADGMQKQLDTLIRSTRSPTVTEPETLDVETREKLRKLGYL